MGAGVKCLKCRSLRLLVYTKHTVVGKELKHDTWEGRGRHVNVHAYRDSQDIQSTRCCAPCFAVAIIRSGIARKQVHIVGWRTSFLRIAQLWCTSRDAMVSHPEPMEAITGVWAGAHLAALHFAVTLRRARVMGSQGTRGAVLGLLLRQLRSNRPPVLLGRGQALAAEGVLQQLHRCRPVLRRRP